MNFCSYIFVVYRQFKRRILVNGFLFLCCFSITSCKEWLSEKPYSLYAVETYFNTLDDATKAVLGIYEIMSNQDTYGMRMSMLYDIASDIAQIEGAALVSEPRNIAHYGGITPQHNFIRNTWQQLYMGIDRANLVIAKIPEMGLYSNGSEVEKSALNRLLGEAKFLRGLYYFDLVRLYGDVPFKTKFTEASDDMTLPRTDREVIYDQIMTDMEEAALVIPWASAKPIDERISKGAVKGVLARVCLFRGGYSLRQTGQIERPANYKEYYQSAAMYCREIMESGEHELNLSYERIFRNYCELTLEPKESMFEVAFYNVTGGTTGSSIVGTYNSPLTHTNAPYGRANSSYKTFPVFFNQYGEGDLRRDIAIANFEINASGNIVPLVANRDHLWAPGKWRRNWQGTSPKHLNNTDINWVLLRYADVLLMRAEAENEINGGPNAIAYESINMVRRRGYGQPLTGISEIADIPAGLEKEAFLQTIQKEKALELCFEGWRKADLIRWNILGDRIRETQAALKAHRSNFPYIAGDYFVDNKHELFPIPIREIELNSNLVQNPNY